MSRSYHTTYTELKGKTKIETEKMLDDPNSILHELAEKSRTKKDVKKQRRIEKLKKETDYNTAESDHATVRLNKEVELIIK